MHVISDAAASELREINEKVRALDADAQEKQTAAEALVDEYRAKGISPYDNAEAFAKIDAAFALADKATEQARELRRHADRLVGKLDKPGGFGAEDLGGAPLGLNEGMLRDLFESAEKKQTLRVGSAIGLYSALGVADFPPASEVTYDHSVARVLRERTRIADLLPLKFVESPKVTFYRGVSPADAAAAVAPGADKPESMPTWEAETLDVVKVAHFAEIQDEIMKDYAEWRDVVGTEMIGGLISAENSQLLAGTGLGENMTGLLNTPNILEVERDTTNESRHDAILRAITALRTGACFCDPSIIVLHPNDWRETRIEKGVDDGHYLSGSPERAAPNTIWGFPVALTTDITEGTGLVANLPIAGYVAWREVPIFEVHGDGGGRTEWIANTHLVRAEERLVLCVKQTEAICKLVDL